MGKWRLESGKTKLKLSVLKVSAPVPLAPSMESTPVNFWLLLKRGAECKFGTVWRSSRMRRYELSLLFHLRYKCSGAQAQDGQKKAMCSKDYEQFFALIIWRGLFKICDPQLLCLKAVVSLPCRLQEIMLIWYLCIVSIQLMSVTITWA